MEKKSLEIEKKNMIFIDETNKSDTGEKIGKIKKFGKTYNLKNSKFRAFTTRAKKLYSLNK